MGRSVRDVLPGLTGQSEPGGHGSRAVTLFEELARGADDPDGRRFTVRKALGATDELTWPDPAALRRRIAHEAMNALSFTRAGARALSRGRRPHIGPPARRIDEHDHARSCRTQDADGAWGLAPGCMHSGVNLTEKAERRCDGAETQGALRDAGMDRSRVR
jgi:hypothetical protein